MKQKLTLFLLILGMTFTVGCQEEENIAPDADFSQEELLSIEETLQSLTDDAESVNEKDNTTDRRWKRRGPRFRTLLTALVKTRLIKTVAKNRLTVLAPTDEAFAKLGITPRNVMDVPNLEAILLYHVLGGKVFARDLEEGFVPTVNGAALEVSLDGGVFFNDSEVVFADIRALNGVIHVIDEVLLPPTKTLYEVVEGNELFTILQAAIEKAELVDVLNDPDANFTVFAPTDDAFVALLSELGLTAEQLLGLPNLDQVLLYHVLNGRVFSSDLSDGLTVTMANGEDISFDLSGMNPAINDVNGRSIPLNTGLLNIQATNGVAHAIDRVLLPTL